MILISYIILLYIYIYRQYIYIIPNHVLYANELTKYIRNINRIPA